MLISLLSLLIELLVRKEIVYVLVQDQITCFCFFLIIHVEKSLGQGQTKYIYQFNGEVFNNKDNTMKQEKHLSNNREELMD